MSLYLGTYAIEQGQPLIGKKRIGLISEATLNSTLELAKKVLRLANLQIDIMLKELQHPTKVWKVVIVAMISPVVHW